MRKGLLIAVVLSASLLRAPEARCQWVQTNGPYGAQVTALANISSIIFAATSGDGVSRSTDSGKTWTHTGPGLTRAYVLSLATCGTVLYAGTYGNGICRSLDSGASWQPISGGSQSIIFVNRLAILGNILFASEGPCGVPICRSDDSGVTWSPASSGLRTNLEGMFVSTLGSRLFATLPAYHMGYCECSTDSGTSWRDASSGLPQRGVWVVSAFGNTVFAGLDSGGVFRSNDGGQSWTQSNHGLPLNTPITSITVLGDKIFAGTYGNGIYFSSDSGVSWTQTDSSSTRLSVSSLSTVGSMLVAAGGLASGGAFGVSYPASKNTGVYCSFDTGTTWTPRNNGLTNTSFTRLVVIDSMLYSCQADGALFRSSDSGDSWVDVSKGLPGTDICAIVKVDTLLYCGIYGPGLYRSNDGGLSWNHVAPDVTYIRSLTSFGETLYVANPEEHAVWQTLDGGISWTDASNGLPPYSYVYTFASADSIFLAGLGTGIYRFEPASAGWYRMNALPHYYVNAIAFDRNVIYANSTDSGGIFRSSDSGVTWTNINGWLPSYAPVTALVANENCVFASTFCNAGECGAGIYASKDEGLSWISANLGLRDSNVTSLVQFGHYLFAATSNSGMYKRPLSDFGIKSSVSKQMPNEPTKSNTLEIYDLLGRQVYRRSEGARPLLHSGAYIERVGGEVRKIFIP